MRAIPPPRSNASRDAAFARLACGTWDLLVVGGGITGTAVARDAALRGLKTALVEQADFAFGTSSRSSRLVHGGLRYLAQLDFGLVREGLVERRRLLDNAPGLVRPVEFLYPVYRGDPDPLWKVNLGVGLYEILALGHGLGGKRLLSEAAVLAAVPQLRREDLRGGVLYRDAATHDTRLTLAVALAARAAGATVVSRCPAVALARDGERVCGASVEDLIGGRRSQVRARVVVLCCGPWHCLDGSAPIEIRTARGTHLSVPRRRLTLSRFLALRSPSDGRLGFAMPVGAQTVIGTTDRFDASAPGEVEATPDDAAYLLALANHSFPGADLGPDDVIGVWAGLRPLVAEGPDKETDEISREHQVVAGAPGLWVLTGGKLTTHRAMAEDCLDRITPTLERGGLTTGPCRTAELPLLPGSLDAGRRQLGELGVEPEDVDELGVLYGARLEHLADCLAAAAPPRPCPPEILLDAQIEVAVEDEWALSLDDLLLRRAGPGPLDLRWCWRAAPSVADKMAALLDWSDDERNEQVAVLREGIVSELAAAGVPLPDSRAQAPPV